MGTAYTTGPVRWSPRMLFMKCHREKDGRKPSSKEKESARLRVVRRIEAGTHPEDLARDLDINLRTVYRWLEKYYYGGEDALKAQPRRGREPKLSALQMNHRARVIRDRNPLQLNFTFALWNRTMVRELIRREIGVRLSETAVGRLLRRLGFSPQRPLHQAYEAIRRGWNSGNARNFWRSSAKPRQATP